MVSTFKFEGDRLKMKVTTGIPLTLFSVITPTITFNMLRVSGQTFLWSYPAGSPNRHVMISADGSFVATGTAYGKVHGLPDACARAYTFPDHMALISEKKFFEE